MISLYNTVFFKWKQNFPGIYEIDISILWFVFWIHTLIYNVMTCHGWPLRNKASVTSKLLFWLWMHTIWKRDCSLGTSSTLPQYQDKCNPFYSVKHVSLCCHPWHYSTHKCMSLLEEMVLYLWTHSWAPYNTSRHSSPGWVPPQPGLSGLLWPCLALVLWR